jgi:hypothetical protein
MQKVEGSSPFIRSSRKARPGGPFGFSEMGSRWQRGDGSTNREYQQRRHFL